MRLLIYKKGTNPEVESADYIAEVEGAEELIKSLERLVNIIEIFAKSQLPMNWDFLK